MPEETTPEKREGYTQHLLEALAQNPDKIEKAYDEGGENYLTRIFDGLDAVPFDIASFARPESYQVLVNRIYENFPKECLTNGEAAAGSARSYLKDNDFPELMEWTYELVLALRPYLFESTNQTIKPEIEAAFGINKKIIIERIMLLKLKITLEEWRGDIEELLYEKLKTAKSLRSFQIDFNELPVEICQKIQFDHYRRKAEREFNDKVLLAFSSACFMRFIKVKFIQEGQDLAEENKRYVNCATKVQVELQKAVKSENLDSYYLDEHSRPLRMLNKSLILTIEYLEAQESYISENKKPIINGMKKNLDNLKTKVCTHLEARKLVSHKDINEMLGKFKAIVDSAASNEILLKHNSKIKRKVNDGAANLYKVFSTLYAIINDLTDNLLALVCLQPKVARLPENKPSPGSTCRQIGIFKTRSFKSLQKLKESTELVTGIIEKKIEQQQKEQEDPSKPKPAPAI